MLMAAMMQTISAQCCQEGGASCAEGKECCDSVVKASGNVAFCCLKKIVAQKTSSKVVELLKSWNYETVLGGGNTGTYKFGNVEYNGNWAFYPDETWAGITYTVTANGVTSVKWMFSSKESYEKFLKDAEAAKDWVKENSGNTGQSFQTTFRNGTREFITIDALNNGLYSVVYQVYALL